VEYLAWYEERASASKRVTEKKVVIVYVSAYGNTEAMARKVADGVAAGGLTPVLLNGVEARWSGSSTSSTSRWAS